MTNAPSSKRTRTQAPTPERYRLRDAGAPFLLIVGAIIALPFRPAVSFGLAGLALVLTVAAPLTRWPPRSAVPVLGAMSLVAIYTVRNRGLASGLGSAAFVGVFAMTVLADSGREHKTETRLVAFVELFAYVSAVGVLLHLVQTNENRRFLGSTVAGQRFSFAFASSAFQAALVAGAGVVVGLLSQLPMSKRRRWALVAISAYLVWGANYRDVEVVLVSVLVGGWLLRRGLPSGRRVIATGAMVILLMPLWWSVVSGIVGGPVVIVLSNTPGLGGRSARVSLVDEARSLNGRTEAWSATYGLFKRSGWGRLAIGHARTGGDPEYLSTVEHLFGRSFVRLDVISSHNSVLEIVRHSGLIFGLLVVGLAVGILRRLREGRIVAPFLVAVLLIAGGGPDTSVTPSLSLGLTLLLLVSLPALRPSSVNEST